MRSFFIWPLLLGLVGFGNCNAPSTDSTSTPSSVAAPARNEASMSTAVVMTPGPDSTQQRVQIKDIQSGEAVYGALLPVLSDADGSVSVQVMVNPQAHTLKKIIVLSTPHKSTVTYKQIGEGIGKYDPTTGRYYFVGQYQKIRKLSATATDYGNMLKITGWINPGDATAAVAHKAIR